VFYSLTKGAGGLCVVDEKKRSGLSLAYDIIKAHGGEIKVETKDGEGSGLLLRYQ